MMAFESLCNREQWDGQYLNMEAPSNTQHVFIDCLNVCIYKMNIMTFKSARIQIYVIAPNVIYLIGPNVIRLGWHSLESLCNQRHCYPKCLSTTMNMSKSLSFTQDRCGTLEVTYGTQGLNLVVFNYNQIKIRYKSTYSQWLPYWKHGSARWLPWCCFLKMQAVYEDSPQDWSSVPEAKSFSKQQEQEQVS